MVNINTTILLTMLTNILHFNTLRVEPLINFEFHKRWKIY
jgi:hypothetical protein